MFLCDGQFAVEALPSTNVLHGFVEEELGHITSKFLTDKKMSVLQLSLLLTTVQRGADALEKRSDSCCNRSIAPFPYTAP